MGYIVPFLTISSITIDVCFNNLIFIGAIFNSYNYWYLLSYSNQFTLHYSIVFLIISIIIILLFFYWIQILLINGSDSILLFIYKDPIIIEFNFINIILYSFFSNFTFFIPIYLDFFNIFSIFFFKGPINFIEVFTGFNLCTSMLFINFFSLIFQIQLISLLLISLLYLDPLIMTEWKSPFNYYLQNRKSN